MKLETQRDRWQAVLDGHEVVDIDGCRVKFIDGYLHTFYNKAWIKTYIDFLEDNAEWQLYEPPKPENKVIVILHCHLPSSYAGKDREGYFEVLGTRHDTENDAIRAAMEWIGEKARKVKIKRPKWVADDVWCEKSSSNEFKDWEILVLGQALLMRWPIEVLEEV